MTELADVFHHYGSSYRAQFGDKMLPSHHQAMRAIERCRTPVLGGHIYICDACGETQYRYHSCRNRHCPKCQNDKAYRWLEKQHDLLLPVPYFCGWRTMYRILESYKEVKERRNQLRHPSYTKPELLATSPNQLWSWDITKLKGPVKWTYYYLYTILDVFSRYVPGWLIAECESAALAKQLIAESCKKQHIQPDQLTLHADRGSAMISKSVAHLLADLGVTKTHSRPHVSNDNPYSESQFKTMKYRPGFPERFGSIQDARAWARPFFKWYNTEHHHSGLGLLTPVTVHFGQAQAVLDQRQKVLQAAYAAHPERFVRGEPKPPSLPTAVWINKPPPSP